MTKCPKQQQSPSASSQIIGRYVIAFALMLLLIIGIIGIDAIKSNKYIEFNIFKIIIKIDRGLEK